MSIKKIFSGFIFFLACNILSAQPHLSLISATGINFPASGDTAYQFQSFDSVTIILMNQDSVLFTDTLDILIKGNSNSPDTIINGEVVAINPFNQFTLVDSSFQFRPNNFDDGDNIVVIWPAARNIPTVVDSLIYHIYYISNAISVAEIDNEPVKFYPNPATEYIYLGDDSNIKRVRIRDNYGRLFYNDSKPGNLIMIEKWKSGIYLIDIEKENGTHRFLKLVKS